MRNDGRRPDELRPVSIRRRFTRLAPGSVLYQAGQTIVLCTASIDRGVPGWREATGTGWLTAEYDMLPGATPARRSRNRERIDGRTQEIQRLIGRSLRAAVDLARIGPHTLTVDCDVLQADGGTRTAAITGGYVALCDALDQGQQQGLWGDDVLVCAVAAVSAGIVSGAALLDLDYSEDAAAAVDCNLVMTSQGEWVEVQASGERTSFRDGELRDLAELGRRGIERLFALQRAALAEPA